MKYLITIFLSFSLFAQDDLDSLWDFNDLPELNDEIEIRTGKGYFPGVPSGLQQLGISINVGWLLNYGNNISSESFALQGVNYSTRTDAPDNEKTDIFSRFNRNNSETARTNAFRSFEAVFLQSYSFLPFLVEYGFGINRATSVLASNLGEKPFLDQNNGLSSFEEHSYLIIDEFNLSGSINFKLPIYGGFIQTKIFDEEMSLGSYYALNLGATTAFPFSSRMYQYNQISTRKGDIRYENGYDTLNFMKKVRADNLNELRFYLKTGLSYTTVNRFVSFALDINYYHPLVAILNDTRWRQGFIVAEIKLYFSI